MALIRMARMLVALLLVAVSAPAAGAVVRSAPVAGPPAPVVAVAPPVAAHTTGAVSAPVAATNDDEDDDDPQTTPAEDLLNPDGTLRLDGTFNGAVDIDGWNVTLDPDDGPVFSPQALTYTWENLGTGSEGLLNGLVKTIAISGTEVFVGGDFTDVGGNPNIDYIARWDGIQWYAVGGASAINNQVNTIVLSGTEVFVGGNFTDVGGNPNIDYIARWNGTAWSGLLSGTSGISSTVNTIAISGTEVFVGGAFTNAGGVSGADYVARAIISDTTSVTWTALLSGTSGISSTVNTIAISGTNVYVGGAFTNAGNVSGANYIARWNSANNTWNPVGAANAISGGIPTSVRVIKVSGGNVYIGGDFTNAGGNNANDYLTRWTGSAFVPFGSQTAGPLGGQVNAVVVTGTNVYVGGNFTDAGGVTGADYVARWNGITWTALLSGTSGINGPVNTIAISGTNVYVGGNFTNAGGVTGADYVARAIISDTTSVTWTALLSGTFGINSPVNAIAISGTEVFVGGNFTNAGNVIGANHIARWNGSTWSAVGPTPSITGTVNTIAISGTEVFVGGNFTNAGGVPGANHIARWNSANNTWNLLGAANAINAPVNTIAISGTDVYVGGDFTNAGGVIGASYIARWNSANNTWNLVGAANAISGGIPTSVRVIKVSGGNVYIGGNFTNAGGNSAANYLVRWDGAQWTALISGTAGVFGLVKALDVPSSDKVYAGGDFLNTGNNPFADRIALYRTVSVSPTVQSIQLLGASPVTNPTSLQFQVIFSEPVANVSADDFTLTTTGTITATIGSVSGSGAVYTVIVTVGGGTAGTATVRLDLKPNTDIADLNGVGGVPAYTAGPAYTVNLVAPKVQSIQLLGASPVTNPTSLSFPFLVIFSEPVVNVSADDFTLTTTGGITATVSGVSGSGVVYTVNTTVTSGMLPPTSTLRLDLKPNTNIVGQVSNVSGTPPYTTGPAYAITSIRVYLPLIVR